MEPSARVPRGSVYVTRACDSCKRRKIKCDAGQPCASCQASDDHCSYTIVPRKRGRVSKQPAELPLTTSPARHDGIEAPINSVAGSNKHPIPTTSIGRESPTFEYSASPRARVSFLAQDPSQEARSIRTGFVQDVAGLLVSGTLEDLVSHCIDLFMQYIFPTTPVCHEPTLRAGVVFFRLETLTDATPYPLSAKTFTLVTALCALVMAVAPESYIPQRALLAVVFLRASRAMLLNYQYHDLEHPDWTSLIIRVWQSSATQNTTGKDGEAHHYYSEASVLALRLRLYDESLVNRKPPLEAQLLRSNFWQLYLSDKSAAVLDNRCRIITEQAFDGELTLLERSSPEVPLLDTTRKEHLSLFESRVHEGHLLKRRIWRDAGNLITAIKSNDESPNTSHLMHLYLDFSGLTDSFPQWLWKPDQYLDGEISTEAAKYYKTCFWAQRSTIMLPYHILKLVILQTCIDHNAPGVIGLDRNVLSWQQRKMDISRDFLCELQMVPFECIKMQGEPSVQRLRKVGTILLELIRNANNESITTRAQSQLAQLLDVLAQLDSRASDWLL